MTFVVHPLVIGGGVDSALDLLDLFYVEVFTTLKLDQDYFTRTDNLHHNHYNSSVTFNTERSVLE